MKNSLAPVIVRIILRYFAGALVAWGLVSPETGAVILSDPDLQAVLLIGVAVLLQVLETGRGGVENGPAVLQERRPSVIEWPLIQAQPRRHQRIWRSPAESGTSHCAVIAGTARALAKAGLRQQENRSGAILMAGTVLQRGQALAGHSS